MIVDGEFSHEQRAEILQRLDKEPQGWRILALALLEEQEWSRQLSVANNASPAASIELKSFEEGTAAALVQPLVNSVQPADSTVQPVVQTARAALNASPSRFAHPWLSALAASILMAVGFYGGAILTNQHLPVELGARNEQLGQSGSRAKLASPQEWEFDGMKMVMTGPNTETSEIPIYDLEEVDPEILWAKENSEIARVNEQLRRRGYELDVRPEYFTSTLNDGRKLVVPVKHVGLKPYGL